MQTYADLRDAQLTGPVAVTIGNFDGLHLGHQALLAHLRALAADLATTHDRPAASALVTFSPHPLAVLRPDRTHLLLTTPRERLLLAASGGIDIGAIHPFTHETARTTAREFCELLTHHLGMAALLVGPDFALGRNRGGDIPTLRALGEELGFALHVIDPVALGEHPVRSSLVREVLLAGDVVAAQALLGRAYRAAGVVRRGDQRGRTVGIPTANIQPAADKLLPGDGVYATRARLATFDRVYDLPSVTNIGVRPTVDGLHRRMETHILDFPPPGQLDDLYGETVAVDFVARLRGEQRFPSLEALVQQIHADIAQARAIFAAESE
jgi:riboflavin kinase/FMN adenylyltransferase